MFTRTYRAAKLCFAIALVQFYTMSAIALSVNDVWINEIHYDNTGGDSGEGVEIGGVAGVEYTNLSLEFYNGNDGKIYKTSNISPVTLVDTSNGYGFLAIMVAGIQNGPSEGIALVHNSNVLQFLSYEGVISASNGTAGGLTSYDIGVDQQPAPSVGLTLQFLGKGLDGNWTGPIGETFGRKNNGQTLSDPLKAPVSSRPVPDASSTLALGGAALLLTAMYRRFSDPNQDFES